MSTLPVKNSKGDPAGDYNLPEGLLVTGKGQQAVYEAVVAHRAARRAGTASTLGKGQVAGSGTKPWRQKGTGNARAGYRQSPVWRGGGVALGPLPRSHRKTITRKTAQLAFRRAFSDKVAAGEVVILDELKLDEPKTRVIADLLRKLEATRGALIVLDAPDRAISLAVRNIPRVSVTTSDNVSTYDLLSHRLVAITRAGMEKLTSRLKPASEKKS